MTNKEAIEQLKIIGTLLWDNISPKDLQAFALAIKALEERPRGEWLEPNKPYYGPYSGKCSVCYSHNHIKTSFCPNCGAYMRGENKVIDDDKIN